jgi:hypothetical protein
MPRRHRPAEPLVVFADGHVVTSRSEALGAQAFFIGYWDAEVKCPPFARCLLNIFVRLPGTCTRKAVKSCEKESLQLVGGSRARKVSARPGLTSNPGQP